MSGLSYVASTPYNPVDNPYNSAMDYSHYPELSLNDFHHGYSNGYGNGSQYHSPRGTERVQIEWRNVNFTVTVKEGKQKRDKQLLSDVHGIARPCEILAIMGGSGAGKTTLLDALAGRLGGSRFSSEIFVNDKPVLPGSSGGFTRAYVLQGDNLHSTLTVHETLYYAARLQLPSVINHRTSSAAKEAADKWVDILGLQEARNVKVGDEDKKGISGGQRRRLSVGIDLLRDPKVIFLDEPISGLDSTSAFKLIKVLSNLARFEHCTILMTIHQPSPRMIELLDSLLVMGDGQVIFQGKETELQRYLAFAGRGRVPEHVSLIEYFLDAVDELKEEGYGTQALAEFHKQNSQSLKAVHQSQYMEAPVQPKKSHFKDVFTLMHRATKIMIRTPELLFGRWAFCTVVGALVATIFISPDSTWQGVTEISSFFLMAAALLNFTSSEVLPIFAMERQILRRELHRGAYICPTYCLAHSLVWTVSMIPSSGLFTVASYWIVGLNTDTNQTETFFFSWLMYFCILFAANAFCMMFSAILTSPMLATSAVTGIFAFMLLLAGFFVARDEIPPYWIWFHYISHFKYSQFGLMKNYFDNMENTNFGCPPPNEGDPNCSLTGQQVLEFYDVTSWNKWYSVGALLGLGVLWRILHCVALIIRYKEYKKKVL
jgi:ABC-type multidrug transport system ATPase subunit